MILRSFFVAAIFSSAALWAAENHGAAYRVRSAAELELVLGKVAPGETVVLQDGNWHDQYLQIAGRGEMARPITIRAETGGKVVLSGKSRVDISGQWLVVDGLRFEGGHLGRGQHVIRFTGRLGAASDSRLTNTSITNYSPPDKSIRYFWVALYGKRNRVDHNRFEGHNHSGVTVAVNRTSDDADEHVIEYNHFLNREPGGRNGFETIRVGTGPRSASSSRTVIQHNLFERTNGELEVISLKSSDNVVRFNTFRQVAGTITLRQGNRNRIAGNYFLGGGSIGTGGIRVTGMGHLIANNYMQDIAGVQGGGIVLICGNDPSLPGSYNQVVNTVIAHNTLIDIGRSLINFDNSCGRNQQHKLPKNVHFINNLLINTVGPLYSGNQDSSWVWRGNMTCQEISNRRKCMEIHGMTKTADGVWRPGEGSPLIDSAVATDYVNDDIDGQPRAGAFDVGADEMSVSPAMFGPLTADRVGPRANTR